MNDIVDKKFRYNERWLVQCRIKFFQQQNRKKEENKNKNYGVVFRRQKGKYYEKY